MSIISASSLDTLTIEQLQPLQEKDNFQQAMVRMMNSLSEAMIQEEEEEHLETYLGVVEE